MHVLSCRYVATGLECSGILSAGQFCLFVLLSFVSAVHMYIPESVL